MLISALLVFVLIPGIKLGNEANNLVTIFINGVSVGSVNDSTKVNDYITLARKKIARENEGLVLINYDLVLSGTNKIFGSVDGEDKIVENIYNVFKENIQKTKEPVYEVKINELTINLRTTQEVLALLNASKKPYDEDNDFNIEIVLDPTRELNVLTTNIRKTEEAELEAKKEENKEFSLPMAGATKKLDEMFDKAESQGVDSYEFGIFELDFGENVEVVQAYADPSDISTLEEAIDMVTLESERNVTYEVVSGDTLSTIAEKTDTTVSELIALNQETIPNEEASLMIGDVLNITSPEPKLSVLRTEKVYYEENYNAPVEYIDNDEWYTTESVVRREPVEGFRKVVADITYRNDKKSNVDIIYEDQVVEAVAKVIERGTKSPPTFIKPLSGGRLSSGFGRRKAPKKGASTYHRGVDWAVPVGTSIFASSGGTVVRAGWGSGYGYCVYIQHPNGMMTRYGHLKKVLVKTGQTVRQGEKIALSGNTGVSTGPHLHFEILVDGVQVNPLTYVPQ
ncbi:MAG: M23 family metallopeptidase [Lachnospiraceae bacterium]|nr:M23 family metallopeptidase [Lachnospiraceae bacterium]